MLAVLVAVAVVVVVLVTDMSPGGGCGPSVSGGTFRPYDRPRLPAVTAVPAGHVLDAVAVGCGGLWPIGSDRSPGSYEPGFRTSDGRWSFRRTPTYSHRDCPADSLVGGPDHATLWLDISCSRPDSTGESIVTDHRVTFS